MNAAELAGFLRSRRARVQPADVGLDDGGRRQTRGLRRAEVADRAGVSLDYYTRLEQGRRLRPSRQVVIALARALQLSDGECNYLLGLVGEAALPAPGSRTPHEGALRLLGQLDALPAMVLNSRYDVLAWNRMTDALVADLADLPDRERNTLRWLFTGRADALAPPDRAQLAHRFVADLRGSGRYPDDRGVRHLVAELSRESGEFAALWARHEVGVNRTVTKTVDHPVAGVLQLSCEVLAVPDSDQRVMVYTAVPGTGTDRALRGLRERVEERTAGC
ncbi:MULTISPECIES: helix-turn-helix domain-containing protein [unclassified Streptomyces]|uniref:MmyB family transcriptional regulator n=1 Tax=unclassified Streptomyces TaxID=2593676 RepID=UPI00037FF94D|nr:MULTISPECIES: helix-turn-helix domain-containing protein [unclassified Streptomyces]MYT33865.1 helix-turn-helix domain-containing protein [Streptomyces sp. SID8354]